jgi:hypothetical protein
MSERVAFLRSGAVPPVPFSPIGTAPEGSWGVVSDEMWLAAHGDAPLELLYLTRADYERAVRGLPGTGIAPAIAKRRQQYALDLSSQALNTVEDGIRLALTLIRDQPGGAQMRAELLATLASFTVVPRFSELEPRDLLGYVRDGDAELIAELDDLATEGSGEHDRDGSEREIRGGFAAALGLLSAEPGREDEALVLPYHDVERVYLISPGLRELEKRADGHHDPVYHWHGGMVLPLPAREIPEVISRGQQAQVLFPTSDEFVGALIGLTAGQLDVELRERSRAPGFPAHLARLRTDQALLRTAARLITADTPRLGAPLAEQARREADLLGGWLQTAGAEPEGARQAVLTTIGDAALLAALCRWREDEANAQEIEELGRAISNVIGQRT